MLKAPSITFDFKDLWVVAGRCSLKIQSAVLTLHIGSLSTDLIVLNYQKPWARFSLFHLSEVLDFQSLYVGVALAHLATGRVSSLEYVLWIASLFMMSSPVYFWFDLNQFDHVGMVITIPTDHEFIHVDLSFLLSYFWRIYDKTCVIMGGILCIHWVIVYTQQHYVHILNPYSSAPSWTKNLQSWTVSQLPEKSNLTKPRHVVKKSLHTLPTSHTDLAPNGH